MNKKTLWIVIGVVAVVVVAGVWYWQSKQSSLSDEEQTLDDLNQALDDSSSMPDLNINSNPAENLPDTNPADKANPFKNVKTNPFQ